MDCPDDTVHRTVSYSEEFETELIDTYPAATSIPQALVMAAQDGVYWRATIGHDFEPLVREIVRDELE